MNQHRNRNRFAVAALIACGTPNLCSVSAAAAPDDACALLTQAEVSAALGMDVEPGRRPVETDPTLCNWREAGKPEGPARNVMLTIIDAKRFASQNVRSVAAPGIGDEAYFQLSSRFPASLNMKKGNQYFRIMARTQATPPSGAETAYAEDSVVDKKIAFDILKKH